MQHAVCVSVCVRVGRMRACARVSGCLSMQCACGVRGSACVSAQTKYVVSRYA